MELSDIRVFKDEIAEKIDEMADLCEHWKKNRENGRHPNAIRSAILMLADEIRLINVMNQVPEMPETKIRVSSFGTSVCEVLVDIAVSEAGTTDCRIAYSNWIQQQNEHKDWLQKKRSDERLWSVKTVRVHVPMPAQFEDMTGPSVQQEKDDEGS